jgi:tyrosinase
MKFKLEINDNEASKAAYVGWTPVKCTLTIENYSGSEPISVTISTGHYDLGGKILLYNNNTTSSKHVDEIIIDIKEGGKITFYIAGEFGKASVGKKDTFIEIKSSEANLLPTLKTDVMVRVRKNANKLKQIEIDNFLWSFIILSMLPPKKTYTEEGFTKTPKNLLSELVLMHTYDAAYEIHNRTSFHPWHRAFLMHLERELQNINPTVTLPYWKFDEKAENVFTENFIGKTESSTIKCTNPDCSSTGCSETCKQERKSIPSFSFLNPLKFYSTAWGPLFRNYQSPNNPATEKASDKINDQTEILNGHTVFDVYNMYKDADSTEFLGWAFLEERFSHNQAHNVFTGLVSDIGKDPADPLFFLLHGNVDRLWAQWQKKYDRFNPKDIKTYPFQGKYTGPEGTQQVLPNNRDIGNFVDDTLWPWNWDHKLSRPTRKWEDEYEEIIQFVSVKNEKGVVEKKELKEKLRGIQVVKAGNVPQIDLEFPTSLVTKAPQGPITVETMIDYQGRLNGGVILGFDYDDVPYFETKKKAKSTNIQEQAIVNNQIFLNSKLPLEERLAAASNAIISRKEDISYIFDILKDENKGEEIRIKAANLADNSKEEFLDISIHLIQLDSTPTKLRSELIHSFFTAKRSNLHFQSRQPQFFNILRGLLNSKLSILRFQAIEILSLHGDKVAQDFLVTEVKKDQSSFISKKDAIVFLSIGLKPEHATLFKKISKESKDEEVKAAAIRGLANAPGSSDLLKKVILDKEAHYKVREAGAFALHNLDYNAMQEAAAQVIIDHSDENNKDSNEMAFSNPSSDSDEVTFKAGLLNMLLFTADHRELNKNTVLKGSLEKISNQSTDKNATRSNRIDESSNESSAIEQLAAKLLSKFTESDKDE